MLFFVGLPIGNLKDITLRALEVLESVDIIACEDTRNTLKLLNHFGIKKKLISYHKFNEQSTAPKIAQLLQEGKQIAVVSDSGMPLISDPGNILVRLLKEQDLPYTVVPGPTAFASALVLSGLDTTQFCFLGFLPDKNKDRQKLLEQTKSHTQTLIFYVSPHALEQDIKDIAKMFGKRKACLVKEITKIHETVFDFTLGDQIEINQKGEFVLLVEGCSEQQTVQDIDEQEQIEQLVKSGLTQNQAIAKVAKMIGKTKQELYKHLKTK
jgi:16S rRNA (cytidine1402-2'-O)-methyltransferase